MRDSAKKPHIIARMKNVMTALVVALLAFTGSAKAQETPESPAWLHSMPGLNKNSNDVEPIDILLDGPTFRYYFEAMLEGSPVPGNDPSQISQVTQSFLDDVLPQVLWVHLKGTNKSLNIEFKFQRALDIELKSRNNAAWFTLYGFKVPEDFSLQLTYEYPVLQLQPVGSVKESLNILVHIPLLPSEVYLHWVKFNPLSEEIEAKAGLLWDWIKLTKKVQLIKPTTLALQPMESSDLEKFSELYSPLFHALFAGPWTQEKP